MKKTILMTLIASILLNGSLSQAGNDTYVWRFNCLTQAGCKSAKTLEQILVVSDKNTNLDALLSLVYESGLILQSSNIEMYSDGTLVGRARLANQEETGIVEFYNNRVKYIIYNNKTANLYQDVWDQEVYRKGSFGRVDLR